MDILKVVNRFKGSEEYNNMITGEKYFTNKCDILNRKFYYYPNNVRTPDPYRANNKIVDNFFRMLVEQKISYCLSKDVIIQNYNPLISINNVIDEIAEEASIKGKAWGHPYINNIGSIKIANIPAQEIIPEYDKTVENNLLSIIRFYDDIEGNQKIEVWTDIQVIYYIVDKAHGQLIEENVIQHNWGKVPFVPLLNNRYEINDLENIKALIDSYDKCISDFANNFEDFQDVYYKLKNYALSNDNKLEDIANIIEFIKQHKMVSVDADGDFEAIQLEIPYLARETYLKSVRELIFLFGQGVDTDILSGGSLTNVVIQARFSNLEQKCNKFLKYVKKFIEDIMYFDVKFKENNGNKETDLSKFNVVFNTSLLINEKEKIESLSIATSGDRTMSTETAVEQNPLVDNSIEELKKISEEDLIYDNNLTQNTNVGE